MHRLKISFQTLSPIVLSSMSNAAVMTKTHSTFGGSIIRGILATRYVTEQNLSDEAHDETFREIFFGGVKFLPANPEIKNQRSFVLPLSLQSGKAGTDDGNKVQDLLDGNAPTRGYKSFRGFGVLDGGQFFLSQVKTSMNMHMSRSNDRERLLGRSVDGQIYNYEAIDAGQNFCGEILGDEKTLLKLRDGLNLDGGKMTAYVGRSKFTQYGKCLVTFGDVEKIPARFKSGGTVSALQANENSNVTTAPERIFLRLDTPLIPVDDCFINAEKILTAEVVDVLGKNFSLGKVYAATVDVENFVVPWGMKRPRVQALAAGTVFELRAENLTDADRKILAEKIFDGFGLRTEEGFGQLRLWSPAENFTRGTLADEKISAIKLSDETIALAKKILTARLLEQVRIFAYDDAKELCPQLKLGNMTHFFTRLGGMLASVDKKNLRENFAARLELELRDGSLFEEHLKKFFMANGQTFFDVFTGQAKLPIDTRSLSNENELEKFKPLIEKINFRPEDLPKDTIYLEYLTNYFRFARKFAASKGGVDRD